MECKTKTQNDMFKHTYGLFGRGELGEREVEGRDIQEKWSISPVWQREETGKREIKHVGPTIFRIFA